MHENREISSTPWSDDQGRSATSRTADMHVLEKSDCAVIPVNQLNKEGQPSAEAVEGRAQTKENIVQSHMHPTQSGNTTQLRIFKLRVCRLWQSALIRRSQHAQMRWERLTPVLNRWIPPPRVLHPYSDARFFATHPS
jgi:hypothetical protein